MELIKDNLWWTIYGRVGKWKKIAMTDKWEFRESFYYTRYKDIKDIKDIVRKKEIEWRVKEDCWEKTIIVDLIWNTNGELLYKERTIINGKLDNIFYKKGSIARRYYEKSWKIYGNGCRRKYDYIKLDRKKEKEKEKTYEN